VFGVLNGKSSLEDDVLVEFNLVYGSSLSDINLVGVVSIMLHSDNEIDLANSRELWQDHRTMGKTSGANEYQL
jgi:hypothetical protein